MKLGVLPQEIGPWSAVEEQAEIAEELGYDSVWVAEHHVQPAVGTHYWAAPLTRLAALAARTDEVELVTSILVLPLHNALKVAEQAAVLDNISDGRLNLGLGLGYVEEEFNAFGISIDDRSGRFVEGVNLLERFFTEDNPISFDGNYYQLEDWEPIPNTVQDPRPPFWLGGWGDLALKRSLRLGDAWIPGLTGGLDAITERQTKLRTLADEYDQDWKSIEKPVMREAIIADTHDEAWNLATEYLHPTYVEEYGSVDWNHPLLDADVVRDFEKLQRERFFVGTPNEIIEQIETFQERIDLTHLGLRFNFPNMPPEVVREQIELFGDEVLPAF